MQTESIEQKIRKIQNLFLDPVDIRLETYTEIDKNGIKYRYWTCDAFCVDDNYHDHDLHFAPESDTEILENSCYGLTATSEMNFSNALDELYNKCVLHINHGYSVYSNEPMIIAIASSLELQ